jgi:uncharacterized protein YndB with AHSA1/START domain
MTKIQVTPAQDAVISEIEIAAPPERVFRAIVNREQALQWGSHKDFEITVWDLEPRVGGEWRFTSIEKATSKEYHHYGEVLEIDPPRLLAYTWMADFHTIPAQRTVVRWELTPSATGTRLKVTHSGLAQLPKERGQYSQGWPGVLSAVKNYLEKSGSGDS